MFFENPVFLYGLFSLAIPVIIHLFNFQRPKVVYFTNLKFIKLADENTKKGIALKHLLILLMRLLFLLFLVLAFARPVLAPSGQKDLSPKAVAVYLDNSMSMQNQVSGGRAIESGLSFLSALSDVSPDGTQFRFTDNSFRYQDQYFLTKEKFKDRLTEESYTYTGREFKNIWNRQLLPISNTEIQSPNTVYWLSDFQKSTSGNLASIVPDSAIQLKIIPIQNPDIANVYIDSVWLASPFIKQGEINYLKVKVANTGQKEVTGMSITSVVDEKPSGSTSVDIPARGSSEIEFGFTASSSGEIKIQLAFEEQPVSFDNQFYAIIHPVAKINIALISSLDESYIKKVYGGEDAFKLSAFSLRNIDYTSLQKANLVIVEDFDLLDDNVVKFLQGYVEGGGSLVLIPGEKQITSKLNGISKSLGLGTLEYINQENKIALAIPDKRQPFFSGIFEEIKSDMTMPEVKNILKWSGWDEDILLDKIKVPYLSAKNLGKGIIYILGSPLSAKYTNLTAHSLFVPLMYKLAIRSQRNQENLAYRVGQSNIQLKINEGTSNTLYSLSNGTFSFIPEQKISGDMLTFSLPKENIEPGFYTLSTTGANPSLIALNADKKESDLATYSVGELEAIFSKYPNVEILPITKTESLTAAANASLSNGDLWKFCIILSLIFLLGEILLIRFFK
jgi:hypothetical protein